eukprot:1422029-Pyramimonas_sp.AAC.1
MRYSSSFSCPNGRGVKICKSEALPYFCYHQSLCAELPPTLERTCQSCTTRRFTWALSGWHDKQVGDRIRSARCALAKWLGRGRANHFPWHAFC